MDRLAISLLSTTAITWFPAKFDGLPLGYAFPGPRKVFRPLLSVNLTFAPAWVLHGDVAQAATALGWALKLSLSKSSPGRSVMQRRVAEKHVLRHLSAKIPDLLIATVAELAEATVWHYDEDTTASPVNRRHA